MSEKINRIYFFACAGSLDAPSIRYRGKYLLDKIEKKYGIPYKIFFLKKSSLPSLLLLVLNLLLFGGKNDIFIFQKISAKGFYSKLMMFIHGLTEFSVYDIDDAVYEIRDAETVDYFITKSKIVIAGSGNLKEYCLSGNPKTFLLTTSVPKPNLKKGGKNGIFTVGWIGIFKVHKENLEKLFFPVLEKLKIKCRFILIGASPEEEKEIRSRFSACQDIQIETVRIRDWKNEDEINRHIAGFDVGVMPLTNNEINKSRSAFKLKQYLSCGVPVLASPVGENVRYVKNGFNGFLCRNADDWKKNIEKFFAMSEDEYGSFVKNSRSSYENDGYSLKDVSEKFAEIIGLEKH